MKRKLLLSLALVFGATTLTMAQSKSTGDKTFVTGLTANLTLNNTTSEATLVLSGPTDRWFAFKLGSFTTAMSSGVDGVYWDGTTLKDANGGNLNQDATQNWTVLTNTVAGATRTITAKRAFSTGDASDYTIVYANANIDIAGAFADSSGDYALASHGGNRAKFVDATFTTLGLDGKEIKDFVVYPNPTKNSFSIQTQEELSSIIVYNNIGKVVGTIKPSAGSYDISFLSNGIYFVEIQAISGKKSYEKIVKE